MEKILSTDFVYVHVHVHKGVHCNLALSRKDDAAMRVHAYATRTRISISRPSYTTCISMVCVHCQPFLIVVLCVHIPDLEGEGGVEKRE